MILKCPRPFCGGRIFVESFITDQGLIEGKEAKCLACGRDFTADLKRVKQRTAA